MTTLLFFSHSLILQHSLYVTAIEEGRGVNRPSFTPQTLTQVLMTFSVPFSSRGLAGGIVLGAFALQIVTFFE